MKVAIISESPADEAALRILVGGLLGEPVEVVPTRIRAGGWNAAVNVISSTLNGLHYRRAAEAMLVVIDSDDSPVHCADHDEPGRSCQQCRLCSLRGRIDGVTSMLRPLTGYPPIRTAVAIAAPAIEAWYLFNDDPACTEAGWVQMQQARTSARPEIERLKRLVYGTERPGLQLETQRAVERANRLLTMIDDLEQFYPNTFGALARDVRKWKT